MEIDSFLKERLAVLRNHHRSGVAPRLVSHAGEVILNNVSGVPGFNSSLEAAQLQVFLADVLLSSALTKQTLIHAQSYVLSAKETIARGSRITQKTLNLYVHGSLIDSVAHKASGNIDAAMNALESSSKFALSEFDANSMDLIPLHRQRVLMLQKKDAFYELALRSRAYRNTNPAEYYATVKRVFEFLLNHHQIDDADRIFKEFRLAYAQAAELLPLIAKVSFIKNLGHYFSLHGLHKRATTLYVNALYVAEKMQFLGQRGQLIALLHESGNKQGVLPKFEILTESINRKTPP